MKRWSNISQPWFDFTTVCVCVEISKFCRRGRLSSTAACDEKAPERMASIALLLCTTRAVSDSTIRIALIS